MIVPSWSLVEAFYLQMAVYRSCFGFLTLQSLILRHKAQWLASCSSYSGFQEFLKRDKKVGDAYLRLGSWRPEHRLPIRSDAVS